jgi:hypothetical protein
MGCSQCGGEPIEARGLCQRHYMQWWLTKRGERTYTQWPNGEVDASLIRLPKGTYTVCTVDGCGRPHKAKGLCMRHYLKSRKTSGR